MFLLVQNTKLIIQEQQQQQQNIVLHATPMQAGSGCRILSKKKKETSRIVPMRGLFFKSPEGERKQDSQYSKNCKILVMLHDLIIDLYNMRCVSDSSLHALQLRMI